MPGPSSEKRNYARYSIWFPVTLESSMGRIWGICRDAGLGGLLMSAVTPVASGLAVTAHFRTSASGTPRVIACKIARCEQNEEEMALAFPFRLGLVFDTPLTSLEEDVKNGT